MIDRNKRRVIAVAVAFLITVAAGLAMAASGATAHTADECTQVRDAVAVNELRLSAALQAGGLTSAQRTEIANEQAIDAAALRHCPAPSPTPSATASEASPSPSGAPTGTASPTPTPTSSPSPPGVFPGPANTGVPTGTVLTTYAGPCVITIPNTLIDSKTINCDLVVRTTGVKVTKSVINGQVNTPEGSGYTFNLTDTEVNAPQVQEAAVGTTGITLLRADIHGGALTVYCFAHCDIRDSWLHGQKMPADQPWHLGALRADDNDDPDLGGIGHHDGGVTDLVAVHNTIACDIAPNSADGGCSGGVTMYGDFGTVNHVTLGQNLLVGSSGLSYCLYGGSVAGKPFPNAHDIVVTNNTFQRGVTGRCGFYGAVDSYDSGAPGNTWAGNTWDTGEPIGPNG